jgi:hypothetical protein
VLELRARRLGILLAIGAGLALGGCGRSPLDLGSPTVLALGDAGALLDAPLEPVEDLAPEAAPDVPPDLPPDMPPDLPPDLPPDVPPDLPPEARPDAPPEAPAERPPVEAGPVCTPQPETCNGVDDDCDGTVDQGLPAIPCPGGGSRYCVSGRYSECPRRCDVCVPGSERECFTSFCTFWGQQKCASDGRSFGTCRESTPPSVCKAIADKGMKTPELEKCCLENGMCCRDDFDLDKDGDITEMLGRCDSVMCGQ